MTTADRELPEERDLVAAEFVLGTLDAAARLAFERELPHHPALQRAVYAWQDRLLGLAARVAPVEPAAAAWPTLEARLVEEPPGAGSQPDRGPAAARPVAAPPAAAPRAANDPLWHRLRRWQAASAAGFALAFGLGALLWLRPPTGAGAPVVAGTRFVAVLEASDRSTGWLVEATAGGALHLVPVGHPAPLPAGRTLQFWTKAEGAAGPTSLGLVQPSQPVELPVARLPALGARQLFELTIEPAAGSPLGRPTGPVAYIGRAVRL